MSKCLFIVDHRSQLSAPYIEKLFINHIDIKEFEVIEMEHGVLPCQKQGDLGAFLDIRKAYVETLLQNDSSPDYCFFVATAYLYPEPPNAEHKPVAADFLVTVGRDRVFHPYYITNQHHA